MSKKGTKALDQPVRDRLVSEFDRNFLVEAGAGSGKTHSLAMRMAAGIAAGKYVVERMAAVTFTRKAAAELRGRFQLALEERLGKAPPEAERQRLETALAGIERLFAGTIHAFCAHLLRERPVDARIAPGFVELDDIEDLRRQRQAWREFVADARASGWPPMLDLLEAGVRPKDLDDSFAKVCEHEDVEFDMGEGEPPAFEPVLKQVEKFWKELGGLRPVEFPPGTKCPAQKKFEDFDGRLPFVRSRRRMASLAGLLTFWNKTTVTQKWWSAEVGRDKSYGKEAKELVDSFQRDVIDPFLEQWRAYIHRLAMAVLIDARASYARARRRQNAVNYVDLLRVTSKMLRSGPAVRRALCEKYRWLFVDEFQDTDPIQAEIFLMLAADEEATGAPAAPESGSAVDPFAMALRPGALFVVGDPKQSIYRFRRADIDIYNRVRQRITETGGEILPLTANFRSLPGVCALANTVFPPLFGNSTPPYSPAFEALDPVRDEPKGGAGPCVAKITVPAPPDGTTAEAQEARLIAAYIQSEVASGRRQYGDFLVLTRQKPRLGVYAEAFDALEIPVEVSGAGLFCESSEVGALALLLNALADPLDSVSLVGVLRGPLFGLSDPELFHHRRAGGRFELSAPLPQAADAAEAAALDARYGPVLASLRRLQDMLRTTRRLPLAAAVERMLEETGWLALAATTPGGARAGHLLQVVDRVREVVEEGGGLADAADALNEEEVSSESEALPLEPGRRDVVRLMNLHKAKGLEAPVVLLADATHAYDFPTVLRVVRVGGVPRGHLKVMRASDKPWLSVTLGQPAGWDAHEAEENKYREAEKLRLLYVAGTRAKDLLVVCRSATPDKNKAWGAFEAYLGGVPELEVPAATPIAKKSEVDLSAAARVKANTARTLLHDRVRQPSWAVSSVTAEKARVAGADTPGHRVDAGAAWGSLIHGLLEHAMRHEKATRADLDRLTRWLTVESPDLRPFIPEALDLVEAVSKAPFWLEARASGEAHVEVPFGVRLEPGQPAAGAAPVEIRTVLHGVIDLVHRAGDGWRILDYKTDRLDGVANVDDELLARYGPQLAQYRFAWERAAGGQVTSSGFVSVRARGSSSTRA